VAAGEATFASYAAEGCRQTIETAACGAELEAAISYGSCVDIAAPEPGTQRPMFVRTQGPGAACSSIRDGFGGLYYGTCDPAVSFCCQGTGGRCGLPTGTGTGVCVAAAQEAVRAIGLVPRLDISNGGLDANWMAANGVPTVTLGCGQMEIHTTKEQLDLAAYEAACAAALRLATA
jgi:hypothetical protein